jgi:type II secretory pathway component GspD/PulD (secretin)
LVSGASNEVGNIVISGDKFNLNTFVAFLNSQGTARLISQPRMALLSGTKGSLRVGENTTIVSKVGTVLGGVSGSLTTVETSQVKTGFDLALFGEVHEGSIYTKISLSLSDLVKIEDKTAGTTTITLPTVAERNVNSIMRARAGDVVILGGISARRDNGDVINSIGQSSKNESNNRSELVIALRPRILHFSSNGVNDVGKTDTLLPAELVRPSMIKEYSDNQNISKD